VRILTCFGAATLLGCSGPEVNLELLLSGEYQLLTVDEEYLPTVIQVGPSSLTIHSERLQIAQTVITLENEVTLNKSGDSIDASTTCRLNVEGLTANRFTIVPAAENGCTFAADAVWVQGAIVLYRDNHVYRFLEVPCELPNPQGTPPAAGPFGAPGNCVGGERPPG
jgi:hypothetical protein